MKVFKWWKLNKLHEATKMEPQLVTALVIITIKIIFWTGLDCSGIVGFWIVVKRRGKINDFTIL